MLVVEDGPDSCGLSVLRQKGVDATGARAAEAACGLTGDVRETAPVGADASRAVEPFRSEELVQSPCPLASYFATNASTAPTARSARFLSEEMARPAT
jgi:hypothetical protein